MRISIIGDSHLNKVSYKDVRDHIFTRLSFRAVDFMNSFEYMVTKNIEEIKPDAVILAGDVYDTHDPSNTVRTFFGKQLSRLLKNDIKVIVMPGQHDICRINHALQPLLVLPIEGVRVIDKPTVTKLGSLRLLLFPYPMQAAQRRLSIRSMFYSFLDYAKPRVKDGEDIMLIGHLGVKGAVKKSYVASDKSQQSVVNMDESDVSIKDLVSSGASHVILGDYHKHQVLPAGSGCYAMYTGSIERTDISEATQEKGFIFFDSEHEVIDGYGKCRFIPYPNTRPMIDLKGSIAEIDKSIDQLTEKDEGAIVRVTFVTNAADISKADLAQHELEKKLRAKIKPVIVRSETNICDAEEERKAHEMEEYLIQEGHMTRNDVIDVVSTIVKEREPDEEEQALILSMAHEIYEECLEDLS